MHTLARNLLAVIAGIVLGSFVNMALVTTGPKVFPPPAGMNMSDAQSLAASAHLLEPRHFVFPFLAHALGTLVGASVAHLTAASKRAAFAYGIGALFLSGGVMAAFVVPAPAWFIALDLAVAYLPMAWLGTRIGGAVRPVAA